MPFIREVASAAPILSAAVVRKWQGMAQSFGWAEDHDPIDEDHLVELIQRLAEAAIAREEGAVDACKELVSSAFQHGRARRVDGFSEDMVFREYHLLRLGLWEELRSRNTEHAAETIMRVDVEITMATAASLQGFHAGGDKSGDDTLVNRIAHQWST